MPGQRQARVRSGIYTLKTGKPGGKTGKQGITRLSKRDNPQEKGRRPRREVGAPAQCSLRGGNAGKGFASPKIGPMLAPGSKLGIDPRLFPQWREDLEFLRDAEPDDARVEREDVGGQPGGSEEHTSEIQSLMRISYAVFCLKKNKQQHKHTRQ